MNWNERNYWNARTYGKAVRIRKGSIKSIILLMAVLIPIVFPIPLAMVMCRFIKQDIIYRW